MPAGRYTTEEFEPSFSFEVEKGWGLLFSEMPEAVGIGTGPNEIVLFHRPRGVVFDPSKPSKMETLPAPENADDWVSWFQQHPNLDTSKPNPVPIGGASGTQIDTRASSVPRDYHHECGDTPCVLLYPFGDIDTMVSFVGWVDRFIVLDVAGEVVVIDIAAPSETFENLSPRAHKVLDTVEWEDAS
jgi:hypothetical protein